MSDQPCADLPEWPKEKPGDLGFANSAYWEQYERARADAAMARLRVAVEALSCLYPALALDLRYCDIADEEDLSAFRSRVAGIEEALAAIGPLPE